MSMKTDSPQFSPSARPTSSQVTTAIDVSLPKTSRRSVEKFFANVIRPGSSSKMGCSLSQRRDVSPRRTDGTSLPVCRYDPPIDVTRFPRSGTAATDTVLPMSTSMKARPDPSARVTRPYLPCFVEHTAFCGLTRGTASRCCTGSGYTPSDATRVRP